MTAVKIIDTTGLTRDTADGAVSHRIVTGSDGSLGMTFGISVMPEGLDAPDVTYPENDEIIYIVSGRVEVTVGGEKTTHGPGMTIFIPKGETYGYKVVEGPNEVIFVYSPAKE